MEGMRGVSEIGMYARLHIGIGDDHRSGFMMCGLSRESFSSCDYVVYEDMIDVHMPDMYAGMTGCKECFKVFEKRNAGTWAQAKREFAEIIHDALCAWEAKKRSERGE